MGGEVSAMVNFSAKIEYLDELSVIVKPVPNDEMHRAEYFQVGLSYAGQELVRGESGRVVKEFSCWVFRIGH